MRTHLLRVAVGATIAVGACSAEQPPPQLDEANFITYNSLAPAAFLDSGDALHALAGAALDAATTDLVDSEDGRSRLRDMPLGRFGQADEVADAVIFLLSDASSLFVGQTLNPNSGGYMP